MKICLYLEFYHFLGGILFRKVGTGLLSSYRNQKKLLASLGIPYVEAWDDSCDILQVNTPWLRSLYLMRRARRRGKKVIIWAHVTVEDAMQVFRFMPLVAPLFKRYLTHAYGAADLVFAPTAYTKGLLVAYGLPAEKIVVQSNGVDTSVFCEDQKKRAGGREAYALSGLAVGTTGLVIPRKGIDTFLALAVAFPDRPFVWFGKLYSKALVKSLPKTLSPNVRFTGYVDDIVAAYNSLDVFVFPSYEENQGMAILEAAAIGLPIIVRDIPVYQGWLRDGVNCLKAKDDVGFRMCLARLIEDADLRAKLSKGARELAKQESLERIREQVPKLYA